jgi:hypothetical protein
MPSKEGGTHNSFFVKNINKIQQILKETEENLNYTNTKERSLRLNPKNHESN